MDVVLRPFLSSKTTVIAVAQSHYASAQGCYRNERNMAKKAALNKRRREKVKKALLERRAALMSDIDGTEQEIDELQDPKADDLDRAVEAGAMELLVALGDTERRELEEVTLALEKLENGSYGHCEACGNAA